MELPTPICVCDSFVSPCPTRRAFLGWAKKPIHMTMVNALYSTENKKTYLKMKDEHAGVAVKEFVGLRPKMYCFSDNKKAAKGLTFNPSKDKLLAQISPVLNQHGLMKKKKSKDKLSGILNISSA